MKFIIPSVSSKFGAWKADRADLKKAVGNAAKKHNEMKDIARVKNIVWTMMNAIIDDLEFDAKCELDERVDALFTFASR